MQTAGESLGGRFDWTDERVARLKELYADGLSASAIAEELGCGSRNAVIGKAHRLGLNVGKPPRSTRHVMRKVERPKIIQAPKMAAGPKSKPMAAPAPVAVLRMPTDAPRGAVAAVMGRGTGQCGYPIGDPREPTFRFCCASVDQEGAIYCDGHMAVAYVEPPKRDGRKKQAARDKYADRYRRHSMDVAA